MRNVSYANGQDRHLVWGLTHSCAINEEITIVSLNRGWVYNQACRLSHNNTFISHSFIILHDLFELIRKRRLTDDSFEFINLIAIKYNVWYAVLQKSFQANFVVNDKLWVSSVKFRNALQISW